MRCNRFQQCDSEAQSPPRSGLWRWRAGAGYAMFAGRECSRALALMSLDPEDCCAELADLTTRQLDTLQEWLDKFRQKYHSVGRVGGLACPNTSKYTTRAIHTPMHQFLQSAAKQSYTLAGAVK